MNSDIGERIIDVAGIVRGFGLVLFILAGLCIIVLGEFAEIEWFMNPTAFGVIVVLFGTITVCLTSMLLKGFGVLICVAVEIRDSLKNEQNNEKLSLNVENE